MSLHSDDAPLIGLTWCIPPMGVTKGYTSAMAVISAASTAFKEQRAERRPRKPRTPLVVSLAKLAARVLPRFATVRRVVLHLGAFATIDYGMWELSRVAGFIAIGVSLLLLDYLVGER